MVNIAFLSRAEWLEWRRKGIGGSDTAAVAGVSRWKSPVDHPRCGCPRQGLRRNGQTLR